MSFQTSQNSILFCVWSGLSGSLSTLFSWRILPEDLPSSLPIWNIYLQICCITTIMTCPLSSLLGWISVSWPQISLFISPLPLICWGTSFSSFLRRESWVIYILRPSISKTLYIPSHLIDHLSTGWKAIYPENFSRYCLVVFNVTVEKCHLTLESLYV